MKDLISWLMSVPSYRFVPLFEVDNSLKVQTTIKGSTRRKLLNRSPEMEEAIIDIVEDGIFNDLWEGLFYIMGLRELPDFLPSYVGKAEKKGVKNPISENIRNIRKNKYKFARWGDGLDYHIGDLSHTLFKFKAYRRPTRKYERWASVLFSNYNPPILKEPVYLYIAPWHKDNKGPSGLISSLPAVEKEIIALASASFKESLFNVDGI